MVRVILIDGRVLTYNRAENVGTWEDYFLVRPDKNHSIAGIKKHLVDRWEYEPPCKITREKTKKELNRDQ